MLTKIHLSLTNTNFKESMGVLWIYLTVCQNLRNDFQLEANKIDKVKVRDIVRCLHFRDKAYISPIQMLVVGSSPLKVLVDLK